MTVSPHCERISRRPLAKLALACGVALAPAFCAHAAPSIELNQPLAPLFDFYWNMNHGYLTACGFRHVSQSLAGCAPAASYGAWADGPLNPYKHGGNTYFQIPHSEFYRIKIPAHNWGARTLWTMEPASTTPGGRGATVTPAQRDQLESVYNNRHWLFSVYNNGGQLYGLTHHEWYRSNHTFTVSGVPGFLNAGNPWIVGIGWAQSGDGGASWTMRPKSEGSRRLVLVPEPSSTGYAGATFGFMHPSNIVREGNYHYAFVSSSNYRQTAQGLTKKHGVVLLRTGNLASPQGWEFWNGAGWTTVNHNTYQGNYGPQQPYLFWESPNDCNNLYAMNVRKHRNGKWITLGSKYCLPQQTDGTFRYQAVFSWTASLANPVDLNGNLGEVKQNGISLLSNYYYSFFDANANNVGDNYEEIGDNPLIFVTTNFNGYYHQQLHLTGF